MEYGLVVIWLAVALLLGVVAAPVTTRLLGDRGGAALSFALSLAVLTVVGHLVGHLAFAWPAVIAGVVALVALSAVVGRSVSLDRRAFGEAAALYAGAFLFVVVLRGIDPLAAPLPLSIGEKLLDIGLVSSLDRAATLPPQDMWFAGEPVVYHYGGHLTTELLATLTGTAPEYAYNLSLAVFFATLVTAAYGLAAAIAAPYSVSSRFAGALGAFFVGIAANLHTAAQVAGWLLPDGVERSIISTLGGDPASAGWTPAEIGANWYFDASRVIPTDPTATDPAFAATEFPLFAWIHGDLHAHVMSQPSVLLLAGLLLAYWRTPADDRRRLAILLGGVPVVAGVIGITNVWSFPSAAGLVFLTVWFAPGDPLAVLKSASPLSAVVGARSSFVLEELRRLGVALLAAVVVALVAIVWTLPFWLGVALNGQGRSIAYWAPWTPIGGFLIHFGAFLSVFVLALAARYHPRFEQPGAVFLAIAGAAVLVTWLVAPALGLFAPLLVGAWWLLRSSEDPAFETMLLVAGVGLVLLVEVVTVPGERFNVIFKPYVEVWLFFAVAAGVMLARMAGGFRDLDVWRPAIPWQTIGRSLLALLVVTTGLYGAIAVSTHVQTGTTATAEQGPTLDATAYLETDYASEAAAIRWLDQREGQPHIVTAAPGGYWWRPQMGDGSSAPASLTGLPTVLGWYHERQYRGPEPYDRRLGDVRQIYTGSPEAQADLLRQYDVRYVYVGPAERNSYDDITVGDLEGVERVGPEGSVAIYRVHSDQLPG